MAESATVRGISRFRTGWRAYFTLPGGNRITPTFPTRAEAEAWKGAADEAKRAGRPIPAPVDTVSLHRAKYQTFEQVSHAWVDQRLRNRRPEEGFTGIQRSRDLLRRHILPALGTLPLASISPAVTTTVEN